MNIKKKPNTDLKDTKIPQEIIEKIKILNVIESTRRPFGALDVDALLNAQYNDDIQYKNVGLIDSCNVVMWLAGEEPNPLKASEWLEENREGLTIEKLHEVIGFAMAQGVYLHANERREKGLETRRENKLKENPKSLSPLEIQNLASKLEMKKDGKSKKSKNLIAQEIAEKHGLNLETVRGYLKPSRKK